MLVFDKISQNRLWQTQVPGRVGKLALQKILGIGYKTLKKITKILSGESTSMDGLPEHLKTNELLLFLNMYCLPLLT